MASKARAMTLRLEEAEHEALLLRSQAEHTSMQLIARKASGNISTDIRQQFQFCVVIRYKRALAMSMILDWQALREACCAFPRLQK